MSAKEMKNCIPRKFCIGDYQVLCSMQDGKLAVVANQHPSGDGIVDFEFSYIHKKRMPSYHVP